MTRRGTTGTTILLVLTLAVTLAGFGTLPAVAQLTDRSGDDDTPPDSRAGGTRTHIEPLIWTQDGVGQAANVLNPQGDQNGDMWPVVVQSNVAPHYPWVVWSRFAGNNYDLDWSRWNGKSWTEIRWVEERGTTTDEMDPDLAFDKRGRPFITWWSEGPGGRGRVFVSVNLNGKWLTPSQVSMTKIDSRYPTIRIFDNGKILIEFMTPRGLVQQGLLFWERTSITDDIDPHFKLDGEAEIVGQPVTPGGEEEDD